jgi:GAF domain-containing protein
MQEKKQLEVLFQISRALVGKKSLGEILQQIVTMTADLADSKICSLMLLNEKKGELVIQATQSLSTAYREKPPIKAGQSVSGRVVAAKHPIQVADVTKDPRYGYPEIAKQEGLRSLLSVPMMIGTKVIGVLNCYTGEERVFSKSEVQLVQTIANQAAIAIEHMRVVAEEAEARLALETKRSVDQAKRILMKRYKMGEEEGHRFIQKTSMDKNKPQKEIADAIILAAELER